MKVQNARHDLLTQIKIDEVKQVFRHEMHDDKAKQTYEGENDKKLLASSATLLKKHGSLRPHSALNRFQSSSITHEKSGAVEGVGTIAASQKANDFAQMREMLKKHKALSTFYKK